MKRLKRMSATANTLDQTYYNVVLTLGDLIEIITNSFPSNHEYVKRFNGIMDDLTKLKKDIDDEIFSNK